jgi:enterochelin esterase-like enzyme
MGNRRTVEVFLPYDYYTRSRAYKVLYANDGQDMAALRMRATLERLYGEGAIEGIIVVAAHTTADRLNEYGTAGIPNSDGLGARADEYTRFLVGDVMAYVNRRYRTLTGAENTAIMGWSLGGLSAFDIAWKHPDLFGTVGVFSGSFWWRTDSSSLEARQSSRIAHTRVREGKKREGLRLWFEAGTNDEADDRDGNGVIDAIQDTTELMDELRLKGYVDGEDMAYVEVEGGEHDQATWARVLPDFLGWAFPAQPRGWNHR